MSCPHCEAAKTSRFCGGYDFTCLGCCVRLVQSTRPLKHLAVAMLAVIARRKDAPSREEILDGLKK